MRSVLDSRFAQLICACLILGTALLCIFTPDVFILKQGANFTVQIMIFFLLLGLGFMIIDMRRLMFISLFASGILSLYLKSTSDQNIRFPSENMRPQISVAHIDLSLSDDYTETMRTIWTADVDVISFQEYTPDWHNYLTEELAEHYPHQNIMIRIDPFGMALYSKFPLSGSDTLLFNDLANVPALYSNLAMEDGTQIHFVTAHTVPAVNHQAYIDIRKQFDQIARYIDELSGPVITLGDFSLPAWSQEIMDFKLITDLQNSRRDIVPSGSHKPILSLRIPLDHIFYSNDIECTSFRVIDGIQESHVGIVGKYQLKEIAALSPEVLN